MKIPATLLFFVLLATSCLQQTEKSNATAAEKPASMTVAETPKYTTDMVVNTKDYACGMPTSAGINDTCHYEGKAYGFCSPECKAEFQKDPAKYIASNK